jgi:chemotaxis methyl-accepting protein methylase
MSVPTVDPVIAKPALKSSPLWNALRHIKHSLVVRFAKRENRVYTQFYRFPHQYRALVERVVPRLRPGAVGAQTEPLEILMFACCSGAEAFSLSYILQKHFPGLRYRIRGFDLVPAVIEQAKSATFTREEVFQGPFVTEPYVKDAFDSINAHNYRVKPAIAAPCSFAVGDLLDQKFMESLGKADVVIAQNVLFHLPRPNARTAFNLLHGALKPGAALFVNGMDIDMRIDLTKSLALEPLDYLVEEIHNDARVDRGSSWAGAYWGRKPFERESGEWLRKHGTIYFKAG